MEADIVLNLKKPFCQRNIAEKFDIVKQCRQLDMELAKDKINDFIQYIASHHNVDYYESIVQETEMVVRIEHPDSFDPPPAKRPRGSETDYKAAYFEISDYILTPLRERFAGVQEYMLSLPTHFPCNMWSL